MTQPAGARIASHEFYATARTALARLACAYADPVDGLHDHHAECLTDDIARSADLLLFLAATITTGDETAMLDALEQIHTTLKRD